MTRNNKSSKIAFITLISLSIITFMLYMNSKSVQMAETTNEVKSLSLKEELYSSVSSDIVCYMENMGFEVQGSIIRARNTKGDSVWSMNFGKAIKNMKVIDSNLIIIDENNKLTSLSNEGKLKWDYVIPDEVTDMIGDGNGNILLEYKTNEGSRIQIADSKGKLLVDTVLKNASVLSFSQGITNIYTLSVLDISLDDIRSKLITFDNKGNMLWAKDFDKKIISHIRYTKNNSILAVVDNKLIEYDNEGKEISQIKLDGDLERLSIGDSLIAVVIKDDSKYYCETFDINLKKRGKLKLDIIPTGIFSYRDKYIIHDKGNILVCKLNGSVVATYESISDISSAYMTSEQDFYIVSSKKLQHLVNDRDKN